MAAMDPIGYAHTPTELERERAHSVKGLQQASARIALLEEVLRRCREKLEINRAHSDGQYHGGMEHTALIRWINEVLPKSDQK